MSLLDLTLAVFLGGMIQTLAVTGINWALRRYYERKTVKRLEQALRDITAAMTAAQERPPLDPEGLN